MPRIAQFLWLPYVSKDIQISKPGLVFGYVSAWTRYHDALIFMQAPDLRCKPRPVRTTSSEQGTRIVHIAVRKNFKVFILSE